MRRMNEQLAERDQACERSENARRLAEQRAETYAAREAQSNADRAAMQKRLDELTQQLAAGTLLPAGSASSSTSQPSTSNQQGSTISGFMMPSRPQSQQAQNNQTYVAPNQSSASTLNQAGMGQFVHTITVDIVSIPIFNDESQDVTVETFLKALRSFVTINGTPQHMLPAIVEARTEGLANDLFRQLTNVQATDLSEIEKALRHAFKSSRSLTALEQEVAFTKQLRGEPVETFYNRVIKAVNILSRATPRHPGMSPAAWLDLWDGRKLSAFLGGLQQETYIFVMTSNPDTIEKAKSAAMLAEQSQTRGKLLQVEYNRWYGTDHTGFAEVMLAEQAAQEVTPSGWRRAEVPPAVTGGTGGDGGAGQNSARRPPTPFRFQGSSGGYQNRAPSSSQGRSPRRSNSCFVCKQDGHWSQECPYRACGVCGQVGHLPWECDQIQKN
jgi:Zinc knuckle